MAAAAAPAAENPFGKFGFTSKEKESVAVPSDLGALSTEQLHTLVRALAAERDELKKKRKADLASPVFQAPPSAKRAKSNSPSAQSLLPGAAKPRASAATLAVSRLAV